MVINNLSIGHDSKEVKLSKILKAHKVEHDFISLEEKKYFDSYNVGLSIGTKISKIDGLMHDIGLQLNGFSTPTGKPVPSEGVYRIEVQRADIIPKKLSELIKSAPKNYVSPICLGTDKFGNDLVVDLNKIPNLLIGGTTGSGKSVLLHNIILSLISADATVFLVDPKFVEFSMYSECKQVVSIDKDVDEFVITLDLLKHKMKERYLLLSKNRARNITEYNRKNEDWQSLKPIVMVIDEWADLVLREKSLLKEICYLAQKGRAAGISIVLATQRPSVNIISGTIKANFPGRICLKVASQIDSKVILDRSGGEKISGVGSALYLDGFNQNPILFKSPFVENPEKFIGRYL